MAEWLLNNRYRIIQSLARGGFGETFLASDTYLPSGRTCVIKKLKPLTDNPQVIQLVKERFEREAAILEQLGEGHPQIPKLYAYFTEREEFYLVQEWIEGETLEAWRLSVIVEENTVREILISLLKVLDYIHKRGIIHRDIKPANIILRHRDKKTVLIDFGIAKEILTTTPLINQSSIIVGTLGFMPPEQAMGKPVFASDLYSLAKTAIYLLTGEHSQNLPSNKFSSSLAAILNKAVQKNLSDRFSTAKEMLQALEGQTIPPTQPILPTKPPTPTIIPHSQGSLRNRQILLNKVKNYWIKGVLETSLHGRALIQLGLESRLDAIDRPWGLVWETANKTQPLPSGTKVIDKFDELGSGRTLLILGEPGAGKTTTLLELTRDLVFRAEQDINQPIPVVFNLSSWLGEKQKIITWLVQELYTKYQVAKEIGEEWVKNQQLLLLLDGLDEVRSSIRDSCVAAINQFHQEQGVTEIVVCSRIGDYESLSNRLNLQAAIYLQPLSLEQIQQFLLSAGTELEAVSTALREDITLQELARSPLILSIITLAYRGISVTDLPKNDVIEERRKHLFDAYIERMLNRRGSDRYPKEKALAYLIWLAQQLERRSQTVFLIERIQPNWLSTKPQKSAYIAGISLIGGITFSLCGAVVGGLIAGNQIGLIYAFILGISGFFITGFMWGLVSPQITTVGTLKWSTQKAKESLGLGLKIGLGSEVVISLCNKLISWLAYGLDIFWIEIIINGLIYGVCIGTIFVLLRGLTGASIETTTIPNQGIWQSLKNTLIFTFIGGLGIGVAAIKLGLLIYFGYIVGLVFGIFGTGEAGVKHFILRIVLYKNNYIPWNYTKFLDWATDRIFLQKVGGGYIFVHRLLLEHFAQIPLD